MEDLFRMLIWMKNTLRPFYIEFVESTVFAHRQKIRCGFSNARFLMKSRQWRPIDRINQSEWISRPHPSIVVCFWTTWMIWNTASEPKRTAMTNTTLVMIPPSVFLNRSVWKRRPMNIDLARKREPWALMLIKKVSLLRDCSHLHYPPILQFMWKGQCQIDASKKNCFRTRIRVVIIGNHRRSASVLSIRRIIGEFILLEYFLKIDSRLNFFILRHRSRAYGSCKNDTEDMDSGSFMYGYELMGDDFFLELMNIEMKRKFTKRMTHSEYTCTFLKYHCWALYSILVPTYIYISICSFRPPPDAGIRKCGQCVSGLSIEAATKRMRGITNARIILNVGSIDILHGRDSVDMHKHFANLVNTCRRQNIDLIITTLAPLANRIHLREIANQVKSFNQHLIKKYSATFKVIDINQCMVDKNGYTIFACYQQLVSFSESLPIPDHSVYIVISSLFFTASPNMSPAAINRMFYGIGLVASVCCN